MTSFKCWMNGNANRPTMILANNRQEALEKFAASIGASVSSYLHAKKVS